MLDRTDQLIIKELSANSRMTMKQLGERVHLTGQATSSRVAKLEDMGIIEGYTLKVNQAKLGLPVHVMIQIFTESPDHRSYHRVIEENAAYIIQNYKVSGESCYLVEARFPSNEVLNEFLTVLSSVVSYKVAVVIG
ncbi:Lrp/AsnC family transcriptional regulator [Jeotgalibacillus haloalkalitolerans]|uniref:Lrp/AsnC family transcriptional regulator n=1 Tax=Jeotgalibacillus haloalkalitolerans TaxID=3104292 RepID=A0ABU5KHQ0_9BACL|nr:Lrp/AsnC family transcriptional regulator [Jeotgalibacillus sp. HH7-29]MDZ5710753.1 Lrp/AsnC family transcriptional regulator [Jeotgalibacillus sp. HH7-29]